MLRAPIDASSWKRWDFEGAEAWSDWAPFTPETLESVPTSAGGYILGLPEGRIIHRVCGVDPHGILDIGEASALRSRLTALHRCASNERAKGHMAGWRLGTLGLLRVLGCSAKDLRLSWLETQDKEAAYRLEGDMLRLYLERFGEPPPLNYKFNWSSFGAVQESDE